MKGLLFFVVGLVIVPVTLTATQPPPKGKTLPDAYYDRLRNTPGAFQLKHGFIELRKQAEEGRELVRQGAAPLGIVQEVRGHKRILVLLVRFNDVQTVPYQETALATKFFGKDGQGQENAGTIGRYYRENSYGKLLVDGDVKPWKQLQHTEAYYAGKDYKAPDGTMKPCFGLCRENSHVAEMVEEAVRANDDSSIWAQYDNDGRDDQPNTADDDGQVDFLVIVHSGRGAECEDGSPTGLWSHQDRLTSWQHPPFVTKTKSNSHRHGRVEVDDYVLVPAINCDGSSPIAIGVVAHEFGHSLGLPDLYDTSQYPKSAGLGNWDLMAGGAWGGDGNSPDMPVHMSAWTKAYLGWVKPVDVTADLANTSLRSFETIGDVLLVTIKPSDGNSYFLLSNRQRTGFDSKVPGMGLFILRVNESRLKTGLANNDVNVDPQNMVQVVEADGLNKLIYTTSDTSFRGGAGDVFPGDSDKRVFDNNSQPSTRAQIAVCNIGASSDPMNLTVLISRGMCPSANSAASLQPIEATISDLLTHPQQWLGIAVRVRGFLENESSNYFREGVKLILQDPQGRKLPISNWLPKEAPPGRVGPGPPVLAQFLNHRVELIGTLHLHHDPDTYVLDVKHGVLVDILSPLP
jgi:M6 family metalloprotease-like protein